MVEELLRGFAPRGWSEAIDFSTPAQPSLSAQAGAYEVTLAWSDPADASITAWQYRQSTDPTTLDSVDWTDIAGSAATTTSHVVTGLTLGSTYHFQLRAQNLAGDGAVSETVSATIPSKAIRIAPPHVLEPVRADAGGEVAALPLELAARGGAGDAEPVYPDWRRLPAPATIFETGVRWPLAAAHLVRMALVLRPPAGHRAVAAQTRPSPRSGV